MELAGRDLPVPDRTTLARRRRTVVVDLHAPGRMAPVDLVLDSTGLKFYGPGEWARQKQGEKRRSWRKLHIAVDAGTGEILSHELTNDDTSDPEMVVPLMEAAGGVMRRVFADGAYDGQPTYDAIRDVSPPKSKPKIVINPRNTSVPEKGSPHGGSEREIHAAKIADVGQIAWQKRQTTGSDHSAFYRSMGSMFGSIVQKLSVQADPELTAAWLNRLEKERQRVARTGWGYSDELGGYLEDLRSSQT